MKGEHNMQKEIFSQKVKLIMDNMKELLHQVGPIPPTSFIICENALFLLPNEFNNWPENEAYYNAMKKTLKEFNAIGIAYIADMGLEDDDSHLPLAQAPNRGAALLFTASMPSYCLHVTLPYSRIGDRIVFGHRIIWESEDGQGTAYTKSFVDVWDDDLNFHESKLSRN
jgi:hypothetical protein